MDVLNPMTSADVILRVDRGEVYPTVCGVALDAYNRVGWRYRIKRYLDEDQNPLFPGPKFADPDRELTDSGVKVLFREILKEYLK